MSKRFKPGIRLKLGTDIRQRQKLIQRRIFVSSLVVVLSLSTYFALQIGSVKEAKAVADPPYYTIADGEWSDVTIWSTVSSSGPACNCEPGDNYNGPGIEVTHSVVSSVHNPLKYSGGGVLRVSGQGKLTVNGNFELTGASTINILNEDTVFVTGNLKLTGGSTITATNSLFRVNGNVTMTGGSVVCGTGSLTYGGALTGVTWCNDPGNGYLPVTLIYFSAKQIENKVELKWSTSSEKDNDFFTVECSPDGRHYEELLRLPGAGTSNKILTYKTIDHNPLKGTSYYRLKQTDFNGQFEYSKTVTVNNRASNLDEEISLLSVSPNPFRDNVSFNFTLASKGDVGLKIFNDSGNCILDRMIASEKGINSYQLKDSIDFPTGIYFIMLEYNGKRSSRKIIKI